MSEEFRPLRIRNETEDGWYEVASIHEIVGDTSSKGILHTATGDKWDLVGLTADNVLGYLTPTDNPGAAEAILKSDSDGGLTLQELGVAGRVTSHLIPDATDAYDLGSNSFLWRRIHASELETIVFAQNTITLLGGWFYVCKYAGTVQEDVDNSQTQIDLGVDSGTLSQNDFIVFRRSGSVEYMQLTSFVSGTTWNVDRNEDETGAEAWPEGSPFAVFGYDGDGLIEFDASDPLRISIALQGTAYNSRTEKVRLGNLSGITSSEFGALSGWGLWADKVYLEGDGQIAGDLLVDGSITADKLDVDELEAVTASTGDLTVDGVLTIDTGGSIETTDLTIDEDGIAIEVGTGAVNKIKFVDGATVRGTIFSDNSGIYDSDLQLESNGGSADDSARIYLRGDDSFGPQIYMSVGAAIGGTETVFEITQGKASLNDDFEFYGDLYSYKSLTDYAVYAFHPLTTPITHTSFDGDSFSDVGTATKIENTSWSSTIPADAKALLIQIDARDSAAVGTAGLYFRVGPSATYPYALIAYPVGGDVWAEARGVVPCTDGDIWYQVEASGTDTLDVYMRVWGYWI